MPDAEAAVTPRRSAIAVMVTVSAPRDSSA